MNTLKWIFSFSLAAVFSTSAFAQTVQGLMMVVKGDIKVTTPDGKTEAAKVGKKVSSGDTITAGPDSRAKIVMADKNVINVSPDSKIVIEKYENDGKDKKNVELNVVYGKVRASVEQKYDGEKSKFNIKTPSAVAGVRGTDFMMGYSQKTKTAQVITFSGSVAVGQAGPGGTIRNPVFVQAGQMTSAGSGQAPEAPKAVPKEDLNKMNSETKADTASNSKQEPAQTTADTKADKKEDPKDEPKDDGKRDPASTEAEADKPADKKEDKPADKPADKKEDKPADKPADKKEDKKADKREPTSDGSGDKSAGGSGDKPSDKGGDKGSGGTNADAKGGKQPGSAGDTTSGGEGSTRGPASVDPNAKSPGKPGSGTSVVKPTDLPGGPSGGGGAMPAMPAGPRPPIPLMLPPIVQNPQMNQPPPAATGPTVPTGNQKSNVRIILK